MPIRTLATFLFAAAAAVSTPAAAAPAGMFLTDAIRGDNGEIAIGSLAARRGMSADVRRFGTMLVRDHSKAKTDAIAVARRERVAVPSGMKPEARATLARLQGLRGRAFDRAFAQAMGEDHRKDIAAFEAQTRTGDRATARLATMTLPHLRMHLQTAQRLGG